MGRHLQDYDGSLRSALRDANAMNEQAKNARDQPGNQDWQRAVDTEHPPPGVCRQLDAEKVVQLLSLWAEERVALMWVKVDREGKAEMQVTLFPRRCDWEPELAFSQEEIDRWPQSKVGFLTTTFARADGSWATHCAIVHIGSARLDGRDRSEWNHTRAGGNGRACSRKYTAAIVDPYVGRSILVKASTAETREGAWEGASTCQFSAAVVAEKRDKYTVRVFADPLHAAIAGARAASAQNGVTLAVQQWVDAQEDVKLPKPKSGKTTGVDEARLRDMGFDTNEAKESIASSVLRYTAGRGKRRARSPSPTSAGSDDAADEPGEPATPAKTGKRKGPKRKVQAKGKSHKKMAWYEKDKAGVVESPLRGRNLLLQFDDHTEAEEVEIGDQYLDGRYSVKRMYDESIGPIAQERVEEAAALQGPLNKKRKSESGGGAADGLSSELSEKFHPEFFQVISWLLESVAEAKVFKIDAKTALQCIDRWGCQPGSRAAPKPLEEWDDRELARQLNKLEEKVSKCTDDQRMKALQACDGVNDIPSYFEQLKKISAPDTPDTGRAKSAQSSHGAGLMRPRALIDDGSSEPASPASRTAVATTSPTRSPARKPASKVVLEAFEGGLQGRDLDKFYEEVIVLCGGDPPRESERLGRLAAQALHKQGVHSTTGLPTSFSSRQTPEERSEQLQDWLNSQTRPGGDSALTGHQPYGGGLQLSQLAALGSAISGDPAAADSSQSGGPAARQREQTDLATVTASTSMSEEVRGLAAAAPSLAPSLLNAAVSARVRRSSAS